MNKVGIYYAFWTDTWDADFIPYVVKVRSLGFDVLEVNSGTVARMSQVQRQSLRKAAKDHGIELTACIGLPQEFDVAAPDSTTRVRGVEYLRLQIRALAEAGITQLGGIVYGHWPGSIPRGEDDRRPYWDRSVASIKEVMPCAEDCGVSVCLEVVNRFEQFLLNTAAEGVVYVRQVDSPNCKLLLDSFHMNIEEDSLRGAIFTAGKYLGHVHLGETNRRAPGRGRMPWREIFGALKEIDYSGSIVMEPFLVPGGEVGGDIRVFRDLRDETIGLDEEARRACVFVNQHLALNRGHEPR